MTVTATVETQVMRRLWHEIRESFAHYFRHDIKRVIAFAVAGFVLGWLVNIALLGFVYNGYSKVPVGAPATGTSDLVLGADGTPQPSAPTLILGSVFWLIASTFLFALISFRLEVGRDEFWSDVRTFPRTLTMAFTTLGVASVGALAWGFAGALLAELLLQPAVTALVAVGLVIAAGARVLRPVVSEAFMTVWHSIEHVMPTRRSPPPATVVVTVGMVGALGAAVVGILTDSLVIHIALIAGAVAAAVALRFIGSGTGGHAHTVALLLALCAGAAVLLALAPHPALALDDGFDECGGDLARWLTCPGSATLFSFSALGGGMSLVGAVFGGALGPLLAGGVSGGPAAPGAPGGGTPAQQAPTPASQPPEQRNRADVVVSGQEAIDALSRSGVTPVTVAGRTGLPAPSWPEGLAYTPLTDASGTPLTDPATGRPLIDTAQPVALVQSAPMPSGATATLDGAAALQALHDAGFPAATDPATGKPLVDAASGATLLRGDPNLIHGNVTGMAFSTTTVNGQLVIDPSAPIVVTQQGAAAAPAEAAAGASAAQPPPTGATATQTPPAAAAPVPPPQAGAQTGDGIPPTPFHTDVIDDLNVFLQAVGENAREQQQGQQPPPGAPPVTRTYTQSDIDSRAAQFVNGDGTISLPANAPDIAKPLASSIYDVTVPKLNDDGSATFTFKERGAASAMDTIASALSGEEPRAAGAGPTTINARITATVENGQAQVHVAADPPTMMTGLMEAQLQQQLDANLNNGHTVQSISIDSKGVHVVRTPKS